MATVSDSPGVFYLPEALWQEMLSHVRTCLPEEACGLVGSPPPAGSPAGATPGSGKAEAAVILPIENELHSPVRFRMAPAGQLKAFYWLEEHGLDLSAIFHSHPQGPDHPSETDLAEFAYPGVLMLIVSPLQTASSWQVRGYRIDGGLSSRLTAVAVPLRIVPPHRSERSRV